MRFKRFERITDDRDLKRQRAAVVRAQLKERDSAPLFSEQIAVVQPDVDEVVEHNRQAWAAHQKDHRQRQADSWRRARARLAAIIDGDLRKTIRELWNDAPYPGNPEYLATLLTDIERGRFPVSRPPWRFTPEEIAEGRRKIDSYVAGNREQAVLA